MKPKATFSISTSAMEFQLETCHQFYRIAKTNDDKNLALQSARMASEFEISGNLASYGPPIIPVKPNQERYGKLLLGNY